MPIAALHVTTDHQVTPLELPDLPDPALVDEEIYALHFGYFMGAVSRQLGVYGEFARYGREREDGTVDVVGVFVRPNSRWEGLLNNFTAMTVVRHVTQREMPGFELDGPVVLIGYDIVRDVYLDLPEHLVKLVEEITGPE